MSAENFDDFQADQPEGQQWEIDFEGGSTRITSLSWIAYKAMEDEDAEVTKL